MKNEDPLVMLGIVLRCKDPVENSSSNAIAVGFFCMFVIILYYIFLIFQKQLKIEMQGFISSS